jgi:hypothetical protein
MSNDTQMTPSEAEIAVKIAADPISAAACMCRQEDKLIAAEKEIDRLRAAIGSVQRSAFDAGYDAHRDGRERIAGYRLWSNT